MSSGTTGKPFTSRAWKYFRIKNKELRLASCKYCHNILSYRSSVSNLVKHLKRKHNKILTDIHEDTSDKSENGEVTNFSFSETDDDSEDNKAVKVLEALGGSKNEEEAVCLLCHETFPEQNSDELMRHMLKVHNISQIKLVDGNLHLEQEESKDIKNTRINRSRCWDYFTIKDKDSKIAVCNFCDKELSYKACVSNLFKHVQRRHRMKPNQSQDLYETNSGEKVVYKPRSAVWSFFNYINYEKTVCACVHCKKEFNVVDGLENMKRHLLEKHPEALLHHKSNGDPLFLTTLSDNNIEGSDDENIHVEYLDFGDIEMPEKNVKANVDRSSFNRRSSKNQRLSSERRSRPSGHRSPVWSVARTRPPDSLEHFSNYITSLLQELPEKVSKRLQMNFVKQIIEAQISCDEMENATETVGKTVVCSDVDGTVDDDVTAVADASAVSEVTMNTTDKVK